MSDTPRTDAETWRDEMDHVDTEYTFAQSATVSADFARQLERELAEVTNQRDLLIEGLEKLESCDWVITLPDRMDAVREIAKETLNKIRP
jgi:cell division protein FtsB